MDGAMNENNVQAPADKKPPEKSGRNFDYRWILLVLLFAIFAGCLHGHYVSVLMENRTNFSHLSELERELYMKNEMAFYYSYFKTVVEEKPFLAGISKIMNDKLVEHPKEVNAFTRFNIHPEVILGSLYRYLSDWLPRECREVPREHGAVLSCIGAGEPVYFYLYGVWTLAGITTGVLFAFGCLLSGSLVGGCLALMSYFANHLEATRVMWRPNNRENLAAPLLLLQAALLTLQLRHVPRRAALALQVAISVLNCLCLLFWEYSQYVFLTQMGIFFLMEQLGIIDWKSFCVFLHAHFCGLHMAALLLHGNDTLKSSLYTSVFLVASVYGLFLSTFRVKVRTRVHLFLEAWLVGFRIATALAAALWLKSLIADFLQVEQDTLLWEVILAKFTDFRNFHTMSYTCKSAYLALPQSSWWLLAISGALPFAGLASYITVKSWLLSAAEKSRLSMTDRPPRDTDSTDGDSGIENADAVSNNKMADDKMAGDKMADVKMADCDAIEAQVREQDEDSVSSDAPERDELVAYLSCLRASVDPAVFYNLCQMCAFGVMAAAVMRLKLLFVPHLCLACALLADMRLWRRCVSAKTKGRLVAYGTTVLAAYLSYWVYCNTEAALSDPRQFSAPSEATLLHWVQTNTPPSAAFAGPEHVTAALMLTARRPVANHHRLDQRDARARKYAAYKAYGRFPTAELYADLSRLRVSYLVLDLSLCLEDCKCELREECTMRSIWDHEAPEHRAAPPLCDVLVQTPSPPHFIVVFESVQYVVIRVHDLSIRYAPRAMDS